MPFRGVLGDSSELRVLRALLAHPWHDFMKVELACEAGVTRPTLDRLWPTLLAHGMVFEVRKLGNIRTYRLDLESPLVKDLRRFAGHLARVVSAQVETKERGKGRAAAGGRGKRQRAR